MTTQTSLSANEIINTVAAEVGLTPVNDPFSSTDENFVRMRYLLNSAIKQLVRAYDWEFLTKQHIISVPEGSDGVFPLPADFVRMIDQTGWERTNRNPIHSLSAQQWQYLKGRDLVSETIYANFRIQDGKFNIFPNPAPAGLEIAFEYVSNLAVIDNVGELNKVVLAGGNRPLFDGYLMECLLKVKFLQARGFDSNAAQAELIEVYEQIVGGDKSAPILNAGRRMYGTRLLNSFNTSDTNYGSPT